MQHPESISVFIADDHPIVRDGLRDILERHGGFEIAGEAGDGVTTLQALRKHIPDVLVLDIEMPLMSGLEVLQSIRDEGMEIRTLVLTMFNQESIFNKAMDLGVVGYMLKDSAGIEIVRGIESIVRGEYFISPILMKYAMRGQSSSSANPLTDLTASERTVLDLIAASRSTNQIAEELHLSPRTIEHYRQRICQKLNLSGSYALLRYALEHKTELSKL